MSQELWLPGVVRRPIPQGANDPFIEPIGDIFHVAVSEANSLQDYFWHRSGGIESTGYIRNDGTIEQYRPLNVECDAQNDGNSFIVGGRRLGFNSWETEGMGYGTWTDAQVESIKKIIAWKHKNYGTPLRVCPDWDKAGFGYHRLFYRWNKNGHSCPGPDRVKQFNDIIVPWMKSGGKGVDELSWDEDIAFWYPGDKDSKDQRPAGQQLNQARGYAQEAFHNTQKILRLLDVDKLADEVAAKVNVKSNLTADDVKQAVKDALAEGVE